MVFELGGSDISFQVQTFEFEGSDFSIEFFSRISVHYIYFSGQAGCVMPELAIILQTISQSSWSRL